MGDGFLPAPALSIVFFLCRFFGTPCIGGLHTTSSKHDWANYDQFAPNFDMACKTILVSVPNLKLFGSMKTELWAEEVGEFSIMLYGKMGWYQHGCRNING